MDCDYYARILIKTPKLLVRNRPDGFATSKVMEHEPHQPPVLYKSGKLGPILGDYFPHLADSLSVVQEHLFILWLGIHKVHVSLEEITLRDPGNTLRPQSEQVR